ncbi:MAG TPA: PHB depolymerase family esterase [Azospirillum sp.]
MAGSLPGMDAGTDRLVEVTGFGSNPGSLRMLAHVPADLPAGAPLVVALHGCTQSAAGYDLGTGWSDLANRCGFAVLLPEQMRENNANLCFTWFDAANTTRDRGEPQSIREMIERMIADHGLDRRRVYVTGLSAGGAMAAVLLATYPEVFAGGAIVAGLPYRAASNMQEAFEAMFQGPDRPAADWGDRVRAASPHRGPWPRVSVWHGSADTTVTPRNAEEIVKQWTDVHGLAPAPTLEEAGPGHVRRVWHGADGEPAVEHYAFAGMAHGVPIHPGEGVDRGGVAGPFMLDVGLSSTHRIAASWGLAPSALPDVTAPRDPHAAPAEPAHGGGLGDFIHSAITKALEAAGLVKR